MESGVERSLGILRKKKVMDGFRGYGLRGDWKMDRWIEWTNRQSGQSGRLADPIHHLSHFFYFSPKIQKSRKVIFKAIYPYT